MTLAVAATWGAAPAAAQRLAVDMELLGGSASMAFGERGREWGLAAGLTVPEVRATVMPTDGDFAEGLHLAAFWRRGTASSAVDVGLRASVARLWECTASDCLPGGFLGGYAAGFFGWQHVKLGARIQMGWFSAVGAEPDAFVVGVVPLIVRGSFGP